MEVIKVSVSILKFLVLAVCFVSSSTLSHAAPILWIGDSNGKLGTIDIANGDVTVKGSMGTIMTDIAFDPDGQLWGIDFGNLYKIDKTTAVSTSVGPLGTSANSLVFDTSGSLYAANSSLYKINTATGSASLAGNGGYAYSSSGDLAFVGGELFLSSFGGDKLVKLNTANGAGSLVGNIGFSSVYGLASPNGSDLYGMSGTQVLSINSTTGVGSPIHNYTGEGLSVAYGTAFFPEAGANPKGMTWGFAGFSDIWANGVTQSCHPSINNPKAKLACKTYPLNHPSSNHCNFTFPAGWETPETNNGNSGTRECDSANGDTACSVVHHVLCVADDNNPYYHRQPPYNNQSNSWIEWNVFIAPSIPRPRYKIHSPPINGQPGQFYEGWVNQPIKLSRSKVAGTFLDSAAKGDEVCGPGWHMASANEGEWIAGMGLNSHYGSAWTSGSGKTAGDKAFHGWLAPDANAGPTHHGDSGMNKREYFMTQRYWVKSNDGGNCWD